jgi:hypothetical protein
MIGNNDNHSQKSHAFLSFYGYHPVLAWCHSGKRFILRKVKALAISFKSLKHESKD